MPTINGDLEVKGNLNALRSISVQGNTAGNISAGPGSLVLAGGSNITLSGSTAPNAMTLSINASAAGGGGLPGTNNYVNFPFVNGSNIGTLRQGSAVFFPFILDQNLTFNQIRAIQQIRPNATSSPYSCTHVLGIYSYNNSTQLSLLGSFKNEFVFSTINNFTSVNLWAYTGVPSGMSTLSKGAYVFALTRSAVEINNVEPVLWGGNYDLIVGGVAPGTNSEYDRSNAVSLAWVYPFRGYYSTSGTTLPNAVAYSEITHLANNALLPTEAWFNLCSF